MKIFSIPGAVLLAAFCSILLLRNGSCDEMVHQGVHGNSKHLNPNQGNSALYGTVITSQEEANSTAYNVAFEKVLRLLRQSFDQESEKISKDLETSIQDLYNFLKEDSYVKDLKGRKGESLSSESHKLNRRSVVAAETQEDEENRGARVPDSGFSKQLSNPNGKQSSDPRDESAPVFSPADRDENQHPAFYPRIREVDTPTANSERDSFILSPGTPLERKLEEFLDDYRSRYSNRHLLNLFPLGRFEDIGLGLPGQPIRRILHQIFERLAARTKPTDVDQQSNLRFPRKLFADGRSLVDTVRENRETGGVGIHKALNLGPLSVKFDVGSS